MNKEDFSKLKSFGATKNLSLFGLKAEVVEVSKALCYNTID